MYVWRSCIAAARHRPADRPCRARACTRGTGVGSTGLGVGGSGTRGRRADTRDKGAESWIRYDPCGHSLREPLGAGVRQMNMIAQMLQISHLLDRKPASLSGGQRQRVAIGRALVREPGVFLFDEPLSNLDAALRIRTRTEIKRLQRELAITSIFVTHDQEEAMVLSDRIAVIRSGQLQQIGPPMEVYREPKNLFVASFIGSPAMNIVELEAGVADGAIAGTVAGQKLSLPLAAVARASLPRIGERKTLLLGIRPTDLVVGAPRELQLSGSVFLVEPVGPVTYVDVDLGGPTLKATCDPDQAPAAGDRVSLGFSAGRVRLFDPTGEDRL